MSWYGELPERWESHKVSEIFTERREKVSDTEFAPLSVSKGGVVPQIATVAKSNAGDNRKLVRKGDFAINSRSDRRGSSGVSQYDGSISLINIVLTPRNEMSTKYWNYLLKSHKFIEEYYRNGRGIVADLWTTRYDEMKMIYLPVPPRGEQDQIVCYLDWKMSQINKLINAKKRQIALLQEQRRVLVNKVVTQGIASTKLMDSGFSWLGKIPVNWHIRTFSKVANVRSNLVPPTDFMDLPQVSPANIEKNTGKLLQCRSVRDSGIISGNHRFYQGQIIYSKVRPMLNKVTIAPFDGLCSADMYPIETSLHTKFLFYYMLSEMFLSQLTMTGNRVKMPKINQDELSSILVLCPPIEEQETIVAYLESKTCEIDTLIGVIVREIDVISEYRTRLISDVVIGKMDVRSVVVPNYEIVQVVENDCTADVEESEDL